MVAACQHFLPYLLGRHFTVVTDHRAFTFLHGKDPTSGRLARWYDALRQLDFDIKFRTGTSNSNADGLSRQSSPQSEDLRPAEKEGEMSGPSSQKGLT